MKVKVSSGNVATLTLLSSGDRAILDCEWDMPPSRQDVEELTRTLDLHIPVLAVQIEDDKARAKFTRAYLQGGESSEVVQ